MKIIFLFIYILFQITAFASKTDTVELSALSENVWIHTTYKELNGNPFPSNGLVIKTVNGLILIDTPWNDEQTETLLQTLKKETGLSVILAIITHAHDDRIGGIRTLLKNNIRTISSKLTASMAPAAGFPSPEALTITDTTLIIGTTKIELFYPGAGHTKDNIVVYIPVEKILFGGCIIKSLASETLGNTVDADMKNWVISIKNLQKKFPLVQTVIPGHGKWGTKKLLTHTISLIKK